MNYYKNQKMKSSFRPAETLKKVEEKNSSKVLGRKEQEILEQLINTVTNTPVLAHTDFNLPFPLHVDVSGSGLGCVLYQKQQNFPVRDWIWKSHIDWEREEVPQFETRVPRIKAAEI